MFVTPEKNREIALNFWNRKPSGRLLWSLDVGSHIQEVSRQCGYEKPIDMHWKELGCLVWAHGISPCAVENPAVEVEESREGDIVNRVYRHQAGELTESLMNGQIVKHKVTTAEELDILLAMWETLKARPELDRFKHLHELTRHEMPTAVSAVGASATQQMLQYETGVEGFWSLAMECPDKLEAAMGLYQNMMGQQYAVMQQVESDGFYQSENTSTTMISPPYYQMWGAPQVRQFTDAAHGVGKSAMVHMCGLLFDLLPYFEEANIDLFHSISPPNIGNVPFEKGFETLPAGIGMLGRFGSLEWIGKSKAELLNNLKRLLPHRIYKEYPFVLLVTADGALFDADDLRRLRDAVAEYESTNS